MKLAPSDCPEDFWSARTSHLGPHTVYPMSRQVARAVPVRLPQSCVAVPHGCTARSPCVTHWDGQVGSPRVWVRQLAHAATESQSRDGCRHSCGHCTSQSGVTRSRTPRIYVYCVQVGTGGPRVECVSVPGHEAARRARAFDRTRGIAASIGARADSAAGGPTVECARVPSSHKPISDTVHTL